MTIVDTQAKGTYASRYTGILNLCDSMEVTVQNVKTEIDSYKANDLYLDETILTADDKTVLDAKLTKIEAIIAIIEAE